jgi:hypothetical protein
MNLFKKIIYVAALLLFLSLVSYFSYSKYVDIYGVPHWLFNSANYLSFDIENYGTPLDSQQRIIGIRKKDNKKEIVLLNAHKVAGFSNSEILEKIAYIPDIKKLVLLQKTPDENIASSTPRVLWEWDGSSGELKKMALNKYYRGFGVVVASPNQKYAAYIDAKERKNIHLFDLVNNTDRILTGVGEKLLLTNGKQVRGYKIGWVDDNTIEYGTYDAANVSDELLGGYSYIGTTRVFIEMPCSDSDGGNNIYEKGTLSGQTLVDGSPAIDFCPAGNILLEYSCSVEGGFDQNPFGMYSQSIPCEYGCTDGACSKKP